MPDGFDYGEMMRELVAAETATYAVEPFDLTKLGALPVKPLRQAAMRTAYHAGHRVHVHRGAVWVSRGVIDRVRALVADVDGDPETTFGQPLRVYADGDAWRWDLGHVAMARAHAELCAAFVSPIKRQQRRLERFARGTS